MSAKEVSLVYFNDLNRSSIVPLKITLVLFSVLGSDSIDTREESVNVDFISLIMSLTSDNCLWTEFIDAKTVDA